LTTQRDGVNVQEVAAVDLSIADPGFEERAQWESLLDALLADRDLLATRIRDELRAQLPLYRQVPDDDLTADIGSEIDSSLSAARAGHQHVNERVLAHVSAVGETRARQGVPIEDMLLAWRIGVQAVLDHARASAAQLGIEPAELLELMQALLASSDRAMTIVARAHRGAELQLAREEQERRTLFVIGVLTGSFAPAHAREQAEEWGLDPRSEYRALRAELPDAGARPQLKRALGLYDMTRPRNGLAAITGGDLAGFVRAPAREDVASAVGIGPPRLLEGLAESFELATRALSTARAFALVGVKSVETLGLLPAVVGDGAVGDALCRRYLEPLTKSAAEIVASLRAYFDCDMQVERAAERLFVHPNTLRYRIARFEEATGANLRDPATMFEVWWALRRDQIAKAHPGHPGKRTLRC
jgi:hypothetical protein